MRSAFLRALSLLLFFSAYSGAFSQDHASDPDFLIQGEYSGQRHSMQVIASGDGEFQIIVFDTPIERSFRPGEPPRRLDGDEDTVAGLAQSLDVKRVVRRSPTLDAKPPTGAIVLFDGSRGSQEKWLSRFAVRGSRARARHAAD